MPKTIKICARLGDYFKDNIIDALKEASSSKSIVELEWMDEIYIVKPSDTYEDIMRVHRQRRLKLYAGEIVARQKELDSLVNHLLSDNVDFDDLFDTLIKYCNLTCDTTLETKRWQVIQFLNDKGFKPNNKNLGACPLNMLSAQLIIGAAAGNLISKDYYVGASKFIEDFKKSPQYTTEATAYNRKQTIDQILKEL